MAITKTIFTGSTVQENFNEVYTWLKENTTEYFDSILDDSDKYINCFIKVNGNDVFAMHINLQVETTPNMLINLHIANGEYVSVSLGGSSTRIEYGIKTPYGFGFMWTNLSKKQFVFFTKNEEGNVFGAAMVSTGVSISESHFYTWDFLGSRRITDWFYDAFQATIWGDQMTFPAQLTSLTPLSVSDSPHYTPNLYRMMYSEYNGVIGKLAIDNTEYFSTGYLALKG
jgi:hypothetical protein